MIRVDTSGELTNQTIQRALDTLATSGGGVLEVPAGTYAMHDSLHLRSGVRVVGEEGTILKRVVSSASPILDIAGYGFYEFTVRDPEIFRPGMGVHLSDDRSSNFDVTVATITQRQGNRFFLDRALNHDCRPNYNGLVRSIFPVVNGWRLQDASLETIVLDGNEEEKHELNGCRGGGVFLLGCANTTLEDVDVRYYAGDGISFQQCVDTYIRHCNIYSNTGSGLHPGSGSVRYVMEKNTVHQNGRFGIFYCLRTTHSICEGNTFSGNGLDGISVGERDTHHWIHGNAIRQNGGAGLHLREAVANSADQVRFENNSLEGNCRAPEGEAAEILVGAGIRQALLKDNWITPGDHPALWVAETAEEISFFGNEVNGRPQRPEDVAGNAAAVSLELNPRFPAVGPAALPLDGAAHLNRAELKPWG